MATQSNNLKGIPHVPVTSKSVIKHLQSMNKIFNKVKDLDALDLHEYLLQLERDYILQQKENFARTVHQLNPLAHDREKG